MKQLNPDYIDAVRNTVNPCPYFDLLSIKITGLEWGAATLEIEVQRKHLQPFGVVHGGVFASIIDAAAFWAAYTQIPEGLGMTSVDLKLNYLAPLAAGRMLATGSCLRAGGTLCLGEASVRDAQGQLLVQGTSTLMILKNARMEGMPAWPRKFLD
jgi:uncharacterized protein (TIGR00369 family)